MGGETPLCFRSAARPRGLSPRGRGNLPVADVGDAGARSIPAWAGKPGSLPLPAQRLQVYPRVGGETTSTFIAFARLSGLSPRGRGNLVAARNHAVEQRSIPAWAGKPPARLAPAGRPAVYPRVGGETPSLSAESDAFDGLSPRGRGNRHKLRPRMHGLRSIPAWAGKPTPLWPPLACRQVYPRVGGETPSPRRWPRPGCGLSPRGRGNPQAREGAADDPRSIPAWAGKPATRSG